MGIEIVLDVVGKFQSLKGFSVINAIINQIQNNKIICFGTFGPNNVICFRFVFMPFKLSFYFESTFQNTSVNKLGRVLLSEG